MEPNPRLDPVTEALVAQLIADSYDYFAQRIPSIAWSPDHGPSGIGLSYHDYEEPLSSYERALLEDPNSVDSNQGWSTPITPVLNGVGSALSPQSTIDITPNGRWDAEAETSEEYKQDQIMALQHEKVMEERVLNGLRIPSPAATTGEGRIAAVAKSLRMPSLKPERFTLSPQATTFVPCFRSVERQRPSRGCGSFGFRNAPHGESKTTASLSHCEQYMPKVDSLTLPLASLSDRSMARGRERDSNRAGEHRLRDGETNGKDCQPSRACPENSNAMKGTNFLRSNGDSTPNSVHDDENANRSRGGQAREDRLEAHIQTTLSPRSCRFFGLHDAEDDNKEEERKEKIEVIHQLTRQDKGKGKDIEHKQSPSPTSGHGPVAGVFWLDGKAQKHHHGPTAPLADDFDCEGEDSIELGEPLTYIPWPESDRKKDRLNDSKVTEIHLGKTPDDECKIKEVFSKISMEDLEPGTVETNGRSVDERAMIDATERSRGFHMGNQWRNMLGANERVVSGELLKKRSLLIER